MELFDPVIECLVGAGLRNARESLHDWHALFCLVYDLFLENGLLPAAFLPGDSLLVLVGVLIAKGAMGFPETLLLLTAPPASAAG
jgi:membrane protein DedA with SNARE-associated domain